MVTSLLDLTITQARAMLDSGEITSVELTQLALDAIRRENQTINAILEVFDDALDQARRADEVIATGTSTPLLGIPLTLKDNILYKGKAATSASKILEGYVASYDSTCVHNLKMQGAVIIGRANQDEFAMGSSTETSAYGITKNPLDTARVPGGSSGGSAASVASGMALGSYGTDTAGSVRQPASFCGLVGLYPTYDTCSRYGIMPMGSSLDQVGPIAKTVHDVAMMYRANTGYDPKDPTSIPLENRVSPVSEVKTIGIPTNVLELPGIHPDVISQTQRVIELLRSAGYTIVDITLPHVGYSLAVYYIIMAAEASTNLACYDGIRYGARVEGETLRDTYFKTKGNGFGAEVQRRMLLGAYVLSAGYYDAYYKKATRLRGLIRKEFQDAYAKVDAILMPTTPASAFEFGSVADPVEMYAQDIFTVPANLVGCPALSVPFGVDAQHMPLGIQLYGPWFSEEALFALGVHLESLRPTD
jgi:aspartyl-tRNA(Asn)/glutamyl-tRNA(Gln) amidotransferase subunit A